MKRTNPSLSRRVGGLAIVGLAITVAACTQKEDETSPSIHLAPRVAITSVEGDTTSELLAAIYARSMENTGVRVVRKDPVAMDRAQYVQAITDGQFQMIPEFSRGLLNFLLDSSSSGSTTTTPTTDGGPATTRAPITIPTTVPPTSEPATSAPGTSAPGSSEPAASSTERRTPWRWLNAWATAMTAHRRLPVAHRVHEAPHLHPGGVQGQGGVHGDRLQALGIVGVAGGAVEVVPHRDPVEPELLDPPPRRAQLVGLGVLQTDVDTEAGHGRTLPSAGAMG